MFMILILCASLYTTKHHFLQFHECMFWKNTPFSTFRESRFSFQNTPNFVKLSTSMGARICIECRDRGYEHFIYNQPALPLVLNIMTPYAYCI